MSTELESIPTTLLGRLRFGLRMKLRAAITWAIVQLTRLWDKV
jgi:hypothetical protein